MTRAECEAKIAEKLREIVKIHMEYNPNANYFTADFDVGRLRFNNSDWKYDEQYPIRYEEEFDPTETDGEQE